MQVYKFGGTSVGNASRMKSVADLVTRDDAQKIVVLSAVSGTTDKLIRLSQSNLTQGESILREMREQYEGIVVLPVDRPNAFANWQNTPGAYIRCAA